MKTVRHLTAIAVILFGFALAATAGEIHDAAEQGDLASVKQLVSENRDLISEQDDAGSTPLHVAATNGHKKIVKYLLKKGAEIDAGDNEHSTPLHVAAQSGHLNVVEYLVAKGADLHFQDDNGASTLHWAAYNGHIEVADFLLKKGADLEARKTGGSTPMHGAAYYGHPEMVKFLVKNGANIEAKNNAGYTPMLSGAAAGNLELVEYLVDVGANLEATNEWNGTALYFAAQSENKELVELLLSKGTQVKSDDPEFRSPLYPVAYEGNIEIAELLIEHGADVKAVNVNGMTPLHMASHNGQAEMAGLLIDKGADPNAKDNEGRTPLYKGIQNGHFDFTNVLVNKGGDSGCKESHCGQTALHCAAIKGYNDVTKLLIKAGADVNATDNDGCTPLCYACKYGHKELADLLKSKGAKADEVEKNFGKCELLTKEFKKGEAVIWYTGHCGTAIKTKNHLLVFDYWNRWRNADEPCLANGHINCKELADQNVAVFATHEHQDHFDTTVFEWADKIKDIDYIYGFQPETLWQYREAGYNGPEYTYVGPREHKVIDGMKISTIDANDAGVGFLVEVDGLTIYHAGDHAGWREGEKDGFIAEIDYLAELVDGVDFAFVNITGCHVQDKDALYEGNRYTVQKLSPKVLIPTHGIHSEYKYREYAEEMAKDGFDLEVFAPMNKGDRFIYDPDSRLTMLAE